MELAPNTAAERYVVEAKLGEGGMARVYRVRHRQLGTVHALKVLSLHSTDIRERLLQEGQVQAKLRHRNIVSVTDVIDVQGSPGLIMEFVNGPSLEELTARQRLTYPQVDALVTQVLEAMAFAHKHDLVHRDLKPANIMLAIEDANLVPKITDFGLAKTLGEHGNKRTATRTGATMGTPHYMSPEQIRDSKNVGPQTDIFALGAILYELTTARRAFDGQDFYEIFKAVAEGSYTPPRQWAPDLPDRMERAIVCALEKDLDRRIPDCDTLLRVWKGELVPGQVKVEEAPRASATPWGAEILAHAQSISGGDLAAEVPGANRSDPTWMPGVGEAAPHETGDPLAAAVRGATFLPEHGSIASFEGSIAPVSDPAPRNGPNPTLLPSPEAARSIASPAVVTASVPPAEGGKLKLLLAGGGVVGVVVLALALLVVGAGLLVVAYVMKTSQPTERVVEVIREVERPAEEPPPDAATDGVVAAPTESPERPPTPASSPRPESAGHGSSAENVPAAETFGEPAPVEPVAVESVEPVPTEPVVALPPPPPPGGLLPIVPPLPPLPSDAVADAQPAPQPERRVAAITHRGFDVPLPADLDPNVTDRWDLRASAVERYSSDTEAIWFLGRVVMTDPNGEVRRKAWGVVRNRWDRGGLGHAKAHEEIAQWIVKSKSAPEPMKRDALDILSYKSTDMSSFVVALGSDNVNVRRAAASTIKIWSEKNPDGRQAAKRALVEAADRETDEQLQKKMRSIAATM